MHLEVHQGIITIRDTERTGRVTAPHGITRRTFGVLLTTVCLGALLVACGGSKESAGSADIPPPPSSSDYQTGKNPALDTVVSTTEGQVKNFPGKVSGQKTYQSTASATDVSAFYTKEMVAKGWKAEQDGSKSAGGVSSLLFSRNNQKTVGFIFIVDGSSLGSPGSVISVGSATQ